MKSQKRFREICSRVFNGIRLKKKNMEISSISRVGLFIKYSGTDESFCYLYQLFLLPWCLPKLGKLHALRSMREKFD